MGDFPGVTKLPSSPGWITTTSDPRSRGVLWAQHLCQVPVWFLVVKGHQKCGTQFVDDFCLFVCLFVCLTLQHDMCFLSTFGPGFLSLWYNCNMGFVGSYHLYIPPLKVAPLTFGPGGG